MEKLLIYSEIMLYLKGIDRLIKEGLSHISTKCAGDITSFKRILDQDTFELIVLYLDYLNQKENLYAELADYCQSSPNSMLLILTDDTVAAGKFFPIATDAICYLDVKSSDKKIITTITQMLGWQKNERPL